MGDVRHLLKMHLWQIQGRTIEEAIPGQLLAIRPFDSVKENDCFYCGRYMSPEGMWPDGLTPRCMHESCYLREIVYPVNPVDWLDKRTPLGQDKIQGQRNWPRELQYNFAEGDTWLYFLILANKIIGSLEYHSHQPRSNQKYVQHRQPGHKALEIPPAPNFSGMIEHKPQMTIDEMLNEMAKYRNNQPNRVFEVVGADPGGVQGPEDMERFGQAVYRATRSPGQDYASWNREWTEKHKQQTLILLTTPDIIFPKKFISYINFIYPFIEFP